MAESKVVIVGAGVIGLTTALLLSKQQQYSITIIAKHMPGDYDIEYASPVAGANYLPVGKAGSNLAKYEAETWPELSRLAENVLDAGIHFQNTAVYNRQKDAGSATGDWMNELMRPDPWYKDVVPNFRPLRPTELPKGHESGSTFTSVCINTAIYLPWLASQCLKNGVIIKRGIIHHITEAVKLHHTGRKADLIVNCTGLGAGTLGGVLDNAVYPARGQIILVRNDPGIMASTSGSDDGPDEVVYVMHRAAGGGCILGGCLQKNSWESQPDLDLAERIMKRCVEICPSLTGGKGIEALSVVRHAVGLRPMREGGPRVEEQVMDGIRVVHHYGHGGYGYQSSYGSAQAAVALVDSALATKSKL